MNMGVWALTGSIAPLPPNHKEVATADDVANAKKKTKIKILNYGIKLLKGIDE